MRLSNKVLITLGIVWAIFLGASYLGAYQYLMKGFYKVENTEVHKDISRVQNAITQVLYSLGTFTIDWAHWNDAYDFIEGHNPGFVPNNLDVPSLINSNVDVLLYLNKQGKILIGIPIDALQKKVIAFPAGLDKYIFPNSVLEKGLKPQKNVRGLIALPSGTMLIASAGVSYVDFSKPINGTIITVRRFSADLLKKIEQNTSIALTMYLPKAIQSNAGLNKIFKDATRQTDDEGIIVLDNRDAYGYLLLKDIYNKPIGLIRLTVPRNIVQTGKETINYYLVIYLVSGLILAVVMWYLLRILILKRLEYLHDEIRSISGQHDYSKRIYLLENDELTSVANQFNEMMQTIQETHMKLKEQISELSYSEKCLQKANAQLMNEINERKLLEEKLNVLHNKLILAARRAGMADIASGVLHNVGNILNSVETSVSVARERVESSKVDKLNAVLRLLEEHPDDLPHYLTQDEKGKKLIPYIVMLAQEWMNDNKFFLDEFYRLDRNIGHIKSVVTMQQSLSTIIGMTEEIAVTDVIDDALMLNKTLYENAKIHIHRDNQLTDRIVIDRVKLLHVMVNLIRNSIESVLGSHVKPMEINIQVKKADDQHITIILQDNGVGILPENLTKIFSYGFTTKKNGHGFGLHTSASFVQEMHGELHAESAGLGKGASFILILPIQPLKRKTNHKKKDIASDQE